ncbi:glutathione transferase GstA [Octadecabacter ascidiaceicola]|uniref:Glutathione S-transferase GST-6.0 n=1 Tax=Octadecabacter ascidiaceicola TaxID=1655543 RepID=A0A238K875_9RHOB|nr:glutathione transferase GstA [Octadecabacter ascidiaceicola]SMX38292.1 Glutathione S-transferase GST-6.0 [Octadecabacter ascidiaceicola]
MKLFYKAGACSLASHIALIETGIPFEIEAVDDTAGLTAKGSDYTTINPKGYVPALQFDDGEVLTEGPAILQFLADAHPNAGLIPPVGTMDRARVIEQLVFVSSELHKAFSALFRDGASETETAQARAAVKQKFNVVEEFLSDGRQTLVNGQFTVADAYLFVVANWANFKDIDLQNWPHLAGFVTRVSERPAVQQALRAEGLL